MRSACKKAPKVFGNEGRLVDAEAGETGGGEGLESLLGADGTADGLIVLAGGGDEGATFEASTGGEFAVNSLLEFHGRVGLNDPEVRHKDNIGKGMRKARLFTYF